MIEGKKNDPVCGMDISDLELNFNFKYDKKDFFFCSKFCLNRFKKDPKRYQKDPLLRLSNIWKIFNVSGVETKVLRGVSLNIWQGDFVAIIGPSGSGKSTILNMMGLLDVPTSGDIYMSGKKITGVSEEKRAKLRSDTFGFVFQQYNLIPWLNAYENVSLPLIFSGKEVDEGNIKNSFKDIGLLDRVDHRPFELSGGEQQRVALLRAIVNDPDIIIGDEPTGNLDSKTGDKILEILINLNKKQNKTLVIVTHDSDIAEKADQIITIRDGVVEAGHYSNKKSYTE